MSWISERETRNAPHIGRGTALAIIFWCLGACLFSLHWAMTTAFVGTLCFSFCWELRDEWRKGADGFDSWDIVADMIGAGLFALAIGLYQVLEKKLYNWPGLFK